MKNQDWLRVILNTLEKQQLDAYISVLALIASWITIILLLYDNRQKNRPYLQISFELVRSSLACIVLRNTGTCPLVIKSIQFDEGFIKQLPLKRQMYLKQKAESKIKVFPNRQWVVSFDVNVFDIINKFSQKSVNIKYTYSEIGKRKKNYNENEFIDFEEYRGMLLYISELDEFKNSVNSLTKTMNRLIDVTKIENDILKTIAVNVESVD